MRNDRLEPLSSSLTRAEQLDALDAVIPFSRREQLAEIFTDEDAATLRHILKQGMGQNTLRALASDLAYLERWCQLATGAPLAGAGSPHSQIPLASRLGSG